MKLRTPAKIVKKPAKFVRKAWGRILRGGVSRGVPPAWFGYRWLETETVSSYLSRVDPATSEGRPPLETIHPPSTSTNPLPRNVDSRASLPDDQGWWGYSFWDVPERRNAETFRATLPDCRIAPLEDDQGRFWVTLVNRDERSLHLREMAFRPWHARVLRSRSPVRLERATWICERVFHNYSHWLTAHLPKLILLKRRGELGEVLLPERRPAVIDESLRLYGMDPERFATFSLDCLVEVEELTVLGTDRFRPELLRLVREDCPIPSPQAPSRRIFVSRAGAERRRLINEEEVWPILEQAGFERVRMEELSFEEQVSLMCETSILVAPHGAGLTNMLNCPSGTHVVEIADLSFPNPNFYATACAMGLQYWLLAAESLGDVHPLEKDLRIEPSEVEALLPRLVDGQK